MRARKTPRSKTARPPLSGIGWAKKHGKSHYGSKNHVNVDRVYELIRRYHVSDAAVHDSQMVDELLMRGNAAFEGWADAA
jgi:transposase, IS5 family